MSTMKEHVEKLVKEAAQANLSHDALHYSQAACNAANAWRVLDDIERLTEVKKS
jgi:hypothetical protein